MENTINLNVITLGNQGVGKTSLVNRIINGTFQETYTSTIGIEFHTLKRKYENKNLEITLSFKDTAGQEKFQTINNQYIRDSHIVLLVFSNIESLIDLKDRWYKLYKENANIENSRFILIGNKSDIFGDEKNNILKEGEKFADEINSSFITCSAKSKDNMDNLEKFIILEAKNYIDDNEKLENNEKSFSLNQTKSDNKDDSKCTC